MKTTMYAIIKKDFRGVAANRRLFFALLIVPLILTIVLPSIFVITIHFIPDDPDIMKLLDLLPETSRMELYPAGILFGHPYYDRFHYGGQCLCGRKRTSYPGNIALLPAYAQADFSGKGMGFFPFEYACLADLIRGYVPCYRNRTVFPYG